MKILLLTVIIWTFAACTMHQRENIEVLERQEFVIPADWKPINECSAKFFVPPDLEEKKPYYVVHFMGGCIKAYGSENIWLNVVPIRQQSDSSEFANQPDFRLEKTEIDGRQADISTFTGKDMVNEATGKEYVAILDVPQMNETTESFYMWAYSKSPADRETVIKIFKSVRFPKE